MNLKYKIIKSELDNTLHPTIQEYEFDFTTTVFQFLMDTFNTTDHFIKGKYANEIEYVIIEGKVYWGINISECKLSDYLDTYQIDILEVYIGSGIGCDALTVLEFLFKVVSYLMAIDWCIEKISKFRCKSFAQNFRKSNGEYILEDTLIGFIQSRKEWKLNELMSSLSATDETLVRCLLYSCGYEAKENDLFVYDEKLYHDIRKELNKHNDYDLQ